MESIHIIFDGDGALKDLLPKLVAGDVVRVSGGRMLRLAGGMTSGRSSIALVVDLPDGKVLVWETSLTLLASAARAFEARDAMEREQSAKAGKT